MSSDVSMSSVFDPSSIPTPPTPGAMVDAVVVSKRQNRLVVEIDNTYTGLISGKEAVDGMSTAKDAAVGDTIRAYVVEDQNDEGYFLLSLKKAGREKAWKELEKNMMEKTPVSVRILEANKGGLMAEVAGIRAFVPVSQLAPEHYPRVNGANAAEILRRLQTYVGQKFIVTPITVDPTTGKLILSEKEAASARRTAAMADVAVGDTITGTVSGIVNFGVFILFNECLEGLVHLSEMSWEPLSDPASSARIGETKSAVITAIEGDKISLSIRQTTENPWKEKIEQYAIGDSITGTIKKITPFGALVEVASDVMGLVPISHIQKEDTEELTVEEGDTITARLSTIDINEQRLVLSLDDAAESGEEDSEKE